MHVQRQIGHPPHRLDDRHADADVRHEVAVHHVQVQCRARRPPRPRAPLAPSARSRTPTATAVSPDWRREAAPLIHHDQSASHTGASGKRIATRTSGQCLNAAIHHWCRPEIHLVAWMSATGEVAGRSRPAVVESVLATDAPDTPGAASPANHYRNRPGQIGNVTVDSQRQERTAFDCKLRNLLDTISLHPFPTLRSAAVRPGSPAKQLQKSLGRRILRFPRSAGRSSRTMLSPHQRRQRRPARRARSSLIRSAVAGWLYARTESTSSAPGDSRLSHRAVELIAHPLELGRAAPAGSRRCLLDPIRRLIRIVERIELVDRRVDFRRAHAAHRRRQLTRRKRPIIRPPHKQHRLDNRPRIDLAR